MRRRRQYDATGEIQRESLAETAEILRRTRRRHRAADRAAADRARADRAPDRGHAALGARPPVGRRGAAGPARRPAHRPRAPARAAGRAARGPDRLVADRRAAPRAPAASRTRSGATCSSSRRCCSTPCRRCWTRSSTRSASGSCSRCSPTAAGPAATWTATRRSAPTRWPARCSCTAPPRCGCCARAWTGSRACSRTPRCGSRSPRSSTDSLEADAQELPSAVVLRRPHREWEPLRTKLGFVHHRLDEHAAPARARARLRRRAGAAARPRARARPPRLAPRRAAARSGGCCGRSTSSASTSPGSTSARARASCARRRRALLPGYADADEPRRQALLTEALVSGRRGIEHDPGGEAGELLRVLDTVALSAEAYGPAGRAGVRDLDDRAAVRRARRALARRSARARPRCGWCRCSRRARRSSRRRRRWPSCTPASPTSPTCARRPTARR